MLNDHDIAVLGMLASSVLFVSSLIFAALWVRARERALRATVQSSKQPPLVRDDIENLTTAIESVAVEVERISEAQRFTARLLAERGEAAGRLKVERVITPH